MVNRRRQATTSRSVALVSWVLAVGWSGALAYRRLSGALEDNVALDFNLYYLPAARAIAAGRSPYEVEGYVYSPVIAFLLAPFADQRWVGTAWIIAMCLAGLLACLAASWAVTSGMSTWGRAAVFAIAVTSLMTTRPFTMELFCGQVNMLVLLGLALAMLATSKGQGLATGFWLGLTGVIKTWPFGLLLWLLRAPVRPRMREWLGVVISVAAAAVLAFGIGGLAALSGMVRAASGASVQPWPAFSAWGAGRLLFGDNGLIDPIAVSPVAQWTLTGLLLVLVLVLLILVLRRPGGDVISLANATFCVLLMLPVSHNLYLVLPLPALWWWIARLISSPRELRALAAVAILGAWWMIALRTLPGLDLYSNLTWPAYLLIFGSTLAAAGASIVLAAGDSRHAARLHPVPVPETAAN